MDLARFHTYVEIEGKNIFVAAAQKCQRAVRGNVFDRLRKSKIVCELGAICRFAFCNFLREAAIRPKPLAQFAD